MTDLRAGKTFYISWAEWVDFCDEYKIDPHKESECSIGLGGGDCYSVAIHEEDKE